MNEIEHDPDAEEPMDYRPVGAHWQAAAERSLEAMYQRALKAEAEAEQLRGAVEDWYRVAQLAQWIVRDRREYDKVTAYAGELAMLAGRRGSSR